MQTRTLETEKMKERIKNELFSNSCAQDKKKKEEEIILHESKSSVMDMASTYLYTMLTSLMKISHVLCLALTASKESITFVSHLQQSDLPLQFVPPMTCLHQQHVCQSC